MKTFLVTFFIIVTFIAVPAHASTMTVNSVEQIGSTALADGAFTHGWKFLLRATIPMEDKSIQMKFTNWIHAGKATISPENNMRISSLQATNSVLIEGANVYSLPLELSHDLDPETPGRQVDILVEIGVPEEAISGSYSTTYSLKNSHREVTGTIASTGGIIRPTDASILPPFAGGVISHAGIYLSLLKLFYGALFLALLLTSTAIAMSRTSGRMV